MKGLYARLEAGRMYEKELNGDMEWLYTCLQTGKDARKELDGEMRWLRARLEDTRIVRMGHIRDGRCLYTRLNRVMDLGMS